LIEKPAYTGSLNPFSNPSHNWNGHRITQAFVPWAVRCTLSSIGHIRPSVRESLKALALDRHQASHGGAVKDGVDDSGVVTGRCAAALVPIARERVGDRLNRKCLGVEI
jgi:hypothetical protein